MKKLAIFGSGQGSNAENICNYFANSSAIEVTVICTNNKNSFIVKRSKKFNIPVINVTKNELNSFLKLQKTLEAYKIDYIILAGFLLKIPHKMVNYYFNRIINIHPSLLPKYGGLGMYGKNIHLSVINNKEIESGISIHFVNEKYDKGEVILQKKCVISCKETVESLEKKIHALELEYFPKTIEKIILK